MKNTLHGKTMESFRNIIDERLVNNKKDYLKWASKPSKSTLLLAYCNCSSGLKEIKISTMLGVLTVFG